MSAEAVIHPSAVLLGKQLVIPSAKDLDGKRTRNGRVTQAVGRESPSCSSRSLPAKAVSVELIDEDLTSYRKPCTMSEQTRMMIRTSLRQDRLCALLADEEVDIVLEAMDHYEFQADDAVLKQGEVGQTFFVVEAGSLSVSISGRVSNLLSRGNTFGGLALLYNCPRTASVTSLEATTCWGASGDAFQKVLRENACRRNAENRKFLDSIQLFEGLPGKVKDTIASGVMVEVFDTGARVVTESEAAAAIYFVKSGSLTVCQGGTVTSTGELVGGASRQAAHGECFGDSELLRGEPYSATVVAVGKCELLSITGKHLREVLGQDLRPCLERALIVSAMRKSSGLSKLSPAQQDAVIAVVEIRTLQPAALAEDSLRFALVLEGSLLQTGDPQSGMRLQLRRGEWFEDEAFNSESAAGAEGVLSGGSTQMTNEGGAAAATKTSGSVEAGPVASTAASPRSYAAGPNACRLAALPRNAFAEALARVSGYDLAQGRGSAKDFSRKMLVIRKAHLFRHLSHEQTDTVVKALISKTYKQNDFVVSQGEIGSAFFVLASGELRVSIDGEVVRTLGKNACFGERALLLDEPRSATIDVVSGVAEVWSLEKEVFVQIVKGKMHQQLVERMKLQDTTVRLKDLVHIKLIGAGACGSVRLVEHRTTATRYALKRIAKENGRIPPDVHREQEILAENDHPFILTYVKTLETPESIYMLTEVVTGGELHAAIRQIPTALSRSQAQFYTGSLVLVLEELYGRGIVYRDLKPENVMLDAQGYLKLVDFGIAKKLREGNLRTFTVVGTPHYMAPEILQGRGYGLEVDMWSLGVLLFEFVCGCLPFADDLDAPTEVWYAVQREPLRFPSRLRDAFAKALITELLTKKPSERLGAGVNGYEDIKMHAYFRATSSRDRAQPAGLAIDTPQDAPKLTASSSKELGKEPPPLFDKIVARELDPPVAPKGETYTPESQMTKVRLDDAHYLHVPPRPRPGSR